MDSDMMGTIVGVVLVFAGLAVMKFDFRFVGIIIVGSSSFHVDLKIN